MATPRRSSSESDSSHGSRRRLLRDHARPDPETAEVTNLNCSIPSGSPSTPKRQLTHSACLAVILSIQIGSGIFSAPAVVGAHVSSVIVGLLIWILAGGLVWTGASSYIELGTSIPENGGIQEYIRYCWGDMNGFLLSQILIVVIKPSTVAMIALVTAEYFHRALAPNTELSSRILKVTALLGTTGVTALSCLRTAWSTSAAKFFMAAKLLGVGTIIVVALISQMVNPHTNAILAPAAPLTASNATKSDTSSGSMLASLWRGSSDLADGTFAALHAYGGWESVR